MDQLCVLAPLQWLVAVLSICTAFGSGLLLLVLLGGWRDSGGTMPCMSVSNQEGWTAEDADVLWFLLKRHYKQHPKLRFRVVGDLVLLLAAASVGLFAVFVFLDSCPIGG